MHERDVAGVVQPGVPEQRAARALLDDRRRGQAYLVLGGAVLTTSAEHPTHPSGAFLQASRGRTARQ